MRQGYLHVCVVLDESASMSRLRDDALFSLKAFLQERRVTIAKEVKVDFYLFAETIKSAACGVTLSDFDFGFLNEVYQCGGATAFNDSFCEAIDSFGLDLANMREEDRPEQVLVAVVTDGRDNRSQNASLNDVYRRIDVQTRVYNWRFEFFYAQPEQLREYCLDDESSVDVVGETSASDSEPAQSVVADVEEKEKFVERVDADANDEFSERVDYDDDARSEYVPDPAALDVDQTVDAHVEDAPGSSVATPTPEQTAQSVDANVQEDFSERVDMDSAQFADDLHAETVESPDRR